MDSLRKTSLVAGVLYLITFVSIPTLGLYDSIRTDPGYITGPGTDDAVVVGAILEIIVAFACIGTAVVLYPVVKRQNQAVALGFVGARVLEAATIVAGVVALLSIVTLRQDGVGAEGLVTGQSLLAQREWTTLLGQSLIPALNALLLGSLLYQSRLVPRILPIVGFIGAPLLIASDIGVLFGAWEPVSAVPGLAALPIALWELSLGVWLVVKGFRTSPITADMAAAGSPPAQ